MNRKAIECYEEKDLIKPLKSENGYRDYSDKYLEFFNKISLFKKIGLSYI
ncbi:MerR family transcriptional regulator [Streptococcus ruminantium]|nr:MerR family transcriptional regulator [Streptococcus ruminantium]